MMASAGEKLPEGGRNQTPAPQTRKRKKPATPKTKAVGAGKGGKGHSKMAVHETGGSVIGVATEGEGWKQICLDGSAIHNMHTYIP